MRVELRLTVPRVVEGTLRPPETVILEGTLLEGIGLARFLAILGSGKCEWVEAPEEAREEGTLSPARPLEAEDELERPAGPEDEGRLEAAPTGQESAFGVKRRVRR
ncbi:MAG: hypothetical protein M0R66_04320 [Candidatus Omnitrophica bacterium]|jgi:hypothetical protein|nr:hypothetical protein [Candidatus Omnitrophota bacterium]